MIHLLFVTALAFVGPVSASVSASAPPPDPPTWDFHYAMVDGWHFCDHVRAASSFDLVVPTSTRVPPPVAVDQLPPVDACVAGERPVVVRHFARGSASYTSTC